MWGAVLLLPACSLALLPAEAAGHPPRTVAQTPSPTARSSVADGPLVLPHALASPQEVAVAAVVRHVDCRSGNDEADGSAAAPWRTPQSLSTRSLPAGAQVLLRRGCAWDGPVRLVGERVELGAFGDGAAPVLTAPGVDRLTPVLTVASPGGRVTDLVIADGPGAGVQLAAAGASVRRSEISGTAFGVQFTAPDGLAEAVFVHDLHMDVNTPGGDDDAGAVGFDVRAPRATIRDSHAERCRAPSYDYGHDGGFVEVWKSGDGLRVLHNTAIDVNGFLEAGGQGGSDSFHGAQISGNKVVGSHGGIGVHNQGQYAIDASGIVFRDNAIQVVDGEVTYGDAAALSIDASNRIGPHAPDSLVRNPAGPGADAATDPAPPTGADAATGPDVRTGSEPTGGAVPGPDASASPREWVYDDGVRAWGLWEWRGSGWVLVEVSDADPTARPQS